MKKNIKLAFINALIMSALMSLTMMVINLGFSNFKLLIWAKSWLLSFAVAFPLSIFLPASLSKYL